MAVKKAVGIKDKNNDTLVFIPPVPEGSDLGGVSVSEKQSWNNKANASDLKDAYIQYDEDREAVKFTTTVAANIEESEAWAKGTKNGEAVASTDQTYHNNSKWYSELASDDAETSEAWAVGTKNGVPVSSTDQTYHNNSKWYKDQIDAHLIEKANKAVVSTYTLSATAWSDGVYHLETTYPASSYDVKIELDGDSVSEDQIKAWSAAKMIGSSSDNKLYAKGETPLIDIPVILEVVHK